jgi:hypothetical protein
MSSIPNIGVAIESLGKIPNAEKVLAAISTTPGLAE